MLTGASLTGGEPWTKKKKKRKRNVDDEAAEPQLPGLVGTGALSSAPQSSPWYQHSGLGSCSGSVVCVEQTLMKCTALQYLEALQSI